MFSLTTSNYANMKFPLLLLCHKKLYFSKYGQLDLFKAPDSISDHLTLIFPENF